MLSRLIKAGADPNEANPYGETPLMYASRNGNPAAIKVLVDAKANVNAAEKLRGTTPLMWAAEQAHPEAIAGSRRRRGGRKRTFEQRHQRRRSVPRPDRAGAPRATDQGGSEGRLRRCW